jgi:RNA polymerase sigma-70 factor (ECF subfamily)
VALTAMDRDLLSRCLKKQPGAWNDFVDRFLSLIYHVIHSTAHLRSAKLQPEDVEDIAAEILLQVVADDYKVIRQFKGNANFSTYLTVISRRICVHELARRLAVKEAVRNGLPRPARIEDDDSAAVVKSIEKLEEVDRLVRKLAGREREIVRLFYLEGRTYEEISTETGVPVNTIGSVLSRARARLRKDDRKKSDDIIPSIVTATKKTSKESKLKSGGAK